jgi:DNA-binding transcriptional LysR family regulator
MVKMFEMMQIFAAVVEHSSLNRAAQVLNTSQPALSRKIIKLEEQLGVQLFERKGKKLILTRVGQISYEYALEMRQLQNKFQQAISDYKAPRKSSITIGASLTTLQSTLPELIALFTENDNETDIKAVTGKTHEIVALVKERKVDVGLVASKIDQPDLNCIPLFDDHLSLVIPKTNHPFLKKSKIVMEDFNDLPLILFSRGSWYRVLMDELFKQYAVFPEIKMEIDSFEAIIRLVSTCKVATLLPHSYLRHNLLEDNELTVINMKELMQTTRTTSLIFGDFDSLSASTRQWIEKARLL